MVRKYSQTFHEMSIKIWYRYFKQSAVWGMAEYFGGEDVWERQFSKRV